MTSRIISLLLAVAALSNVAIADFMPVKSETITEGELQTPGFTENISNDSIVFCLDSLNGSLVDNDVLTFTLTGGAKFANATMSIEVSQGGAGTGDRSFATQSPADATGLRTVTFKVTNAASIPFIFNNAGSGGLCDGAILSGVSFDLIPGQSVDFSFTNPWTAQTVDVNGTLVRAGATLTSGSVKLFDLPPVPIVNVPALPLWSLWILVGLTGIFGVKRLRKVA